MRVVSVDHGPLVRSELFADVIDAEGHELVEWEIGAAPQPRGPFDAWIVLGVLPPRFEALVGNGYAFEVPIAGVELAASEVQPQAFRIGARAWAVQFHPEARRTNVTRWFEEDERAGTLPRPLPELEQELEAKIGGWHELGRALCLAFLAAASPAAVSRGA